MLKVFSKKLEGFTLIELLVVVAIIGLLASIASVAASEARNKAKNAAIQATLIQVKAQATLILHTDEAYDNLCDADHTLNDTDYPNSLGLIEDEVKKYNGNQDLTCYASGDVYCVQSPLVKSGDYCIDSTGYAGTDADCDGTDFSCH